MAYDGVGKIYIAAEDWCEFLARYAPGSRSAEIRYSQPRIENGDLVVDYAFSTESAPESWVNPPDWLKGK